MNENLPQNQQSNNALIQLNEFETGLKQVLNLHNLPTNGVFVDIPERELMYLRILILFLTIETVGVI